jgi:DNA-binding transcriptional regulator YhcF (GntR family)
VIIEVDPSSPTPPYEQLRAQLATMIATGTLPEGTQLPPIRQLAADLGLAANTVARAYRELESARLVHSRVRHGTVVAARPRSAMAAGEIARLLDDAATSYATTARQLGVDAQAAHAAVARALAAVAEDRSGP